MGKRKTYSISGMIRLWRNEDTIELNDFRVVALTRKQAVFLMSKGVAHQRGMNLTMFYQRVLKSKLIVKEV